MRLFLPGLLGLGLAMQLSTAHGAPLEDRAISFLEERVKSDPDDFTAWNRLAGRYQDELRRTGETRFLSLATEASEQSLKAMPAEDNPGGLTALAQARLSAHRFSEARDAALALQELLPGKSRPLELLTDALFELGDYAQARVACAELVRLDTLGVGAAPRQAKLDWIAGKTDSAKEHLERGLALSAKLLGSNPEITAWFQVQLGELAFKTGDWEAAEASYTAAAAAQPGSYSAADHLAELRAAEGHTVEAIGLYEKLAKRLPRPEFFQALGDLLLAAKRPEEAAPWMKAAEEGFLGSVQKGGVHYFHHLAGFYADSKEGAEQALEWAREDLGLRHSIYAYDSYAWALYKNGRLPEAAEAMGKALATGTRDPHLLYHAGLIRMAAGDIAAGKAAFQQAAAVNPRFNSFHVHR